MILALESGVPHQRPEDPRLNLEPPFWQVIRLLRWQRRLILTCAVVGAILGGVIRLVIPPRYTATAELATEPQLGLPALPPWNRSPTLPANGDKPTKQAR